MQIFVTGLSWLSRRRVDRFRSLGNKNLYSLPSSLSPRSLVRFSNGRWDLRLRPIRISLEPAASALISFAGSLSRSVARHRRTTHPNL